MTITECPGDLERRLVEDTLVGQFALLLHVLASVAQPRTRRDEFQALAVCAHSVMKINHLFK